MPSISVCTHISVNATDANPSIRGERNGKLGVVLGFLEEVIARQSHLVHIVNLHTHTQVSVRERFARHQSVISMPCAFEPFRRKSLETLMMMK